ncbi:hypothetical protein ES703_26667 [subsurface metagenome]
MALEIGGKLQRFKAEINSIRRGNYKGRIKPHKPLMLLAVLDLMNAGIITENRVTFDNTLKNKFQELFLIAHKEGDWCHPSEPFFHLRTAGFWFHKPRRGKEKACADLDTSGGGSRRILENIEYAFFDPDSFMVLMDAEARWELLNFVLQRFFQSQERRSLLQCLEPKGVGNKQGM